MPKITYVAPEGTRYEVDAEVGTTVMENAVKNLVPGIEAECGGGLLLLLPTCHVYVDDAWSAATGERSRWKRTCSILRRSPADLAPLLPDQGQRRARRPRGARAGASGLTRRLVHRPGRVRVNFRFRLPPFCILAMT